MGTMVSTHYYVQLECSVAFCTIHRLRGEIRIDV